MILGNLITPVLSGLVLCLATVAGVQWIQLNNRQETINSLNERVGGLVTGLETSEKSLVEARSAIDQQNRAIDLLGKRGRERDRAAQELADELRRARTQIQGRADDIMNLPGTGDSCRDSDELINREISRENR